MQKTIGLNILQWKHTSVDFAKENSLGKMHTRDMKGNIHKCKFTKQQKESK